MREVNDAFKTMFALSIFVFLVVIVIFAVELGTSTVDSVTNNAIAPISSMADSEAFYMSYYNKPIPVPTIWGWVLEIGTENVEGCTIDGTAVNVDRLMSYFSKQATFSYSQTNTGKYSLEVQIV